MTRSSLCLVAALLSVLVVGGCGGQGQLLPSDLLPSQPLAADPEIAKAIEFRLSMGLQADEAWVRHVAADPTATMEFGVPLLPVEADELMSRGEGVDGIAEAVAGYAAQHPEGVGGLYIDNAAGGDIVVLVVGDAATHEAAIRGLLPPGTEITFRTVRFAEADLIALQEHITREADWLRSIGAPMQMSSVDTIGNRVELHVSSDDPAAPALIAGHFAAPEGMLEVRIDGTGIATKPLGRIEGRAVDADGRPVAGLDVRYTPDIDIGPIAGVGITTDADGAFVLASMPPTGYTVELYRPDGGDGWILTGRTHVEVPAGGVATVEIVVEGG